MAENRITTVAAAPPVYPFSWPNLRYFYNQLEPFISEKSLRHHHQSIHAGFVERLNLLICDLPILHERSIEEILRNLDQVPQSMREKVKNEGGGHANHQFLWKILSPESGAFPKGALLQGLNESFGSFENFKIQFAKAVHALNSNGWVFLVVDPKDAGKLKLFSGLGNESVLYHGTPGLLICDGWDHAYLDQATSDYLDAYWKLVDWEVVAQRLEGIRSGRKQL